MIKVNLEIKGTDGIKSNMIEFPNSYDDLTYKQFITINKILLEDIPNRDRDKKILSYLLGITVEEIGGMYNNIYNELLDNLKFLLDEVEVTEPVKYLKLNGQNYFMRDVHTLSVDEQEFIYNIEEEYGIFESIPYKIGLLFTLKGEEDKVITREQLDKMAGFVQSVSYTKIYNVFFSSGNMPQISTNNIVKYLKQQLTQIADKSKEMI